MEVDVEIGFRQTLNTEAMTNKKGGYLDREIRRVSGTK